MAEHREDRLSLVEIARAANVSPRQLERLFRRYLDSTPARWYLRMRLTRARQLLIETQMPVTWIAVACGFGSTSHFSKNYRQFFGVCPREERRQRRAAREPTAPPPLSRAA
ncbi:MAG: helix-turn-helix domain-containing protein [Alphaproteobacteria bacterium]|nr:helix-turn-helix domain-containing protein [Alphaproteobacteria bacterium]